MRTLFLLATSIGSLLAQAPQFPIIPLNGGGPPTGAAGGDLGGTYPNPTVVSVADVTTGVLGYANGGCNSSTAWTQGSVLFAGASACAQDNANFFWDGANKRFGIGTNTPALKLDVLSSSLAVGDNIVSGTRFLNNGFGPTLGYHSTDGATADYSIIRAGNNSDLSIGNGGAIYVTTTGAVSVASTLSGGRHLTATNCSSSASPAVCSTAAAGSVVVAAAATTVVVNTTAVTANSQIFLLYDSSLGTKLSVTCNTTEPALYGVTARVAATSFTITSTAPVTNPACFSFFVVN